MKAMITLAAVMFSVAVNAAVTVKPVTVCAASADVNQGTLAIETVTNLIFAPLDLTTGSLLDLAGNPATEAVGLVKVAGSDVLDSVTGTVAVTYSIVGSTEQAVLTYKTNTDVAQYELVSAVAGTSFAAPVLVKDQLTTDELIKSNGPGFVCSAGDATFTTL